MLARRRTRRLASFAAPRRVVNPMTGIPVTGWVSTPALTTDDWIVPSARRVETTLSPCSRCTRPPKPARSVMGRLYRPAGRAR